MNHIKIIAEIGCNHNGNKNLAKKMVTLAKECGVDGVKFQTFNFLKKNWTDYLNFGPKKY